MKAMKPALITLLIVSAVSLVGWGVEQWAKQKYGKKTKTGNPVDDLIDDHDGIDPGAAVKASLPDMCEHCKRVYLIHLAETKGGV